MSTILRLPLAELQAGMYIVDMTGKPGIDSTVYSVEGYVLSTEECAKWQDRGYTCAMVDPVRTRFSETRAQAKGPLSEFDLITRARDSVEMLNQEPKREFAVELTRALELQKSALDMARTVAFKAATDDAIPVAELRGLFVELVASVKSNPNVLLCLGKLKTQDNYIFYHSLNVAALGVAMGLELGIRSEYLPDLALGGFLYDIGKILIPQDVLTFPGQLADEGLKEMQQHVERGHQFLLHQKDLPQMVFDGVLDHHERFDGHGYPNGKKGNAISFTGRVLAVADVYDALTSKRCYRDALPPMQALSILYNMREKEFSPGFVETLISTLGVYPPGSLVRLSNKQLAMVLEANPEARMQPKVLLLADTRGMRLPPKMVDLNIMSTLSIAAPATRLPPGINVESALKCLY